MLIVQKHLQAITKALVGKEVAPIGELLDKIKQLQEAVGLLNSMVLSGEEHSEVSRKIVQQALMGE